MDDDRRGTSTSSFGVGRREAHDASEFYARFTPPTISTDDTVRAYGVVDEIYCLDARQMDTGHERLKNSSVALVVTSPPYFAGKEYEQALGEGHIPGSYVDYLEMLHGVFAACVDKLEPGGRIAVNVANLGRKPYRSLSSDVIAILQDRLGLLLRGEIIWQKSKGATGSCAWGSYQSAANPVLRDLTERIIVASKGRFDRAVTRRNREQRGLPADNTIAKDDFMDATTDVWDMAPELANRVGHPAPFPVELPQRLMELYTYAGDLVVDPFMGSGTTAVAAIRTGRHFVGFDTDRDYVGTAKRRINAARTELGEETDRPAITISATKPAPPTTAIEAMELGEQATTIAEALLGEAGFTSVTAPRRPVHGVDIALVATDRLGGQWYIDVVGALTTPTTGLRRLDALWRTLGKATTLRAADDQPHGFLALTTDLPTRGTRADKVLRTNSPQLLTDALELLDPDTPARLTWLAAAGPAASG